MRDLSKREWQQALITFYTQNLNFWLLENLNGYETVDEAKAKAYADSVKVKNYPFSPNGAEVPEDVKVWYRMWLDEITSAGKEQKSPESTKSKRLAELELRIDQLQQSILEAKAVIPFNKSDIEELIDKRVREHEEDSCHPWEDDIRREAEEVIRDWDVCCVSDIEDRINDAIDKIDLEGRVKSVLRDIASDF